MQSLRYFRVKKKVVLQKQQNPIGGECGKQLGVLYHVRNLDKKECICFTPFITLIVFLPPQNKLVLKEKYPLYLIQDLKSLAKNAEENIC